MPHTDVAIVGAGPAGAWAAYKLARAGARVTLFDGSHPREKPCGGGVTRRALTMVGDAIDVGALPRVVVDAAVFEDGDHPAVRVPLTPAEGRHEPALVVASRREFDGQLLRAALGAGATLVPDRIVRIEPGHRGFTVATRHSSLSATHLIGADGANSLVRRVLMRPFSRGQLSIAAGYFAHGVSSSDIVIRFVPDPQGYLWSFPRPGHLAIGVCAQADDSASPSLRAIAAGWIERAPWKAGELEAYSWPIPSLSPRDLETGTVAHQGALLVGDAAGLVDPITREGIFFALQSAEMAAHAIVSATDPGVAYNALVRDQIYPELRKAARLKAGFFRPAFIRLLMRALAESSRVRAVMADLVSGEQPYATLERRLLGTLELSLAWDLLRLRRRPAQSFAR